MRAALGRPKVPAIRIGCLAWLVGIVLAVLLLTGCAVERARGYLCVEPNLAPGIELQACLYERGSWRGVFVRFR